MTSKRLKKDEAVVYVGNKEPMKYVLAVITQFENGAEEVIIKARGRLISRAVDVAEILRNKFMKEVKIGKIITSTEKVKSDDEEVKVSMITIPIKK